MASKHLMRYSIKMNFDFGKITGSMSDEVDKTLGRMGRKMVHHTKTNLAKGKHRPLRESTLKSRRAGSDRFGVPTTPTKETKPLIHTGALLRSIKEKKISSSNVGMEMLQYGMLQHSGWVSGGKYKGVVQGRPFMPYRSNKSEIETREAISSLDRKMIKDFKKIKTVFTNRITKKITTTLK